MVRIGHTHHQLQTIEALKKSLSPYNDKKWIQKKGMCSKHKVLDITEYYKETRPEVSEADPQRNKSKQKVTEKFLIF